MKQKSTYGLACAALVLFRFELNRGKALSHCFLAIPDAKTVSTFAGIALALWAVFTQSASANERASLISIANQFYAAISPSQDAASMQAKISSLLAPEAQIVIEDLGITQTRAEFIDSLDNWSDAIAGGFVAHKVEAAGSADVTVLVCYNFGENTLTTREILTVKADDIIKTVQTKIADDCAEF